MPRPESTDFAEGIQLCIKNAQRYVQAGKELKSKDRQTSYLCFMYALEEMGKVPIMYNGLFYAESDVTWHKWLIKFKDHGEKFWYSKDLDDFSEGKLADKQNVAEKKMADRKLEVAYVDLAGSKFKPPAEVTEESIIKIESDCDKRLALLKRNHASPELDAKNMAEGYERLKGMSEAELRKVAEKAMEELSNNASENSL